MLHTGIGKIFTYVGQFDQSSFSFDCNILIFKNVCFIGLLRPLETFTKAVECLELIKVLPSCIWVCFWLDYILIMVNLTKLSLVMY